MSLGAALAKPQIASSPYYPWNQLILRVADSWRIPLAKLMFSERLLLNLVQGTDENRAVQI